MTYIAILHNFLQEFLLHEAGIVKDHKVNHLFLLVCLNEGLKT